MATLTNTSSEARRIGDVMTKPSLFIGSSSEGLDFARAARFLLTQDAEVTVWREGFFALGSTYIEALMNSLPRFDFAILVFTPDDAVNSREIENFGPRDNVIFELGLFLEVEAGWTTGGFAVFSPGGLCNFGFRARGTVKISKHRPRKKHSCHG